MFTSIELINRLVLKDGCKLELQMPKTMKLFGSTKKLLDITKNRENVSLKVDEVVQCNLVDSQYQQKTLLCPLNLMRICYMLNQVT